MCSLSVEQIAHIRDSFARQSAMTTIRAELTELEKGHATIRLPFWDGILQQVGFIHGGVVAMIADSAAGYAALTMAPEGA